MKPNNPAITKNLDHTAFLNGGGEMGELIRAFDWSKTSLGPISQWPQCLKTAVNLSLQSPVPLALLWGKEGVMIYNDAYARFSEGKHPSILGKPVMEAWPETEDLINNYMEKGFRGESLSLKDLHLVLYRNKTPEDVWVDVNYSPIMDEIGKPAGVFAIVVETTKRILTEEALQKSQERFRLAMGAAELVGTFDWHIQTDLLYSDERFARFYSLEPEKGTLGVPISEYVASIHPDDVKDVMQAVEHTIATGERYSAEYRLIQKDSSVRWIAAQGECLYNEEGKPWRFPGVGVDITERKQAEEALRESEQRFSSIFNQTSVGIAQTDLSGKFVLVNDHYCEILKCSKEELYQMTMQDVTHPDDLRENLHLFQQLIQEGKPFTLEKRYIRPDGSEVWVNNEVSLIRDQNGHPLYTVAVSLDITDRKQAEVALKESEERFRFLADASPALIWMTDSTGKLTYHNKTLRDYTGYSEEDIDQKGWEPIVHPDDLPVVGTQFLTCLEEQRPFEAEFRTRRYDGTYQWFLSTGLPRYTQSGEFIGFVGSGFNVDDRKRAEEALRESEARFRTMADSSPLFVWISDAKGQTTYVNNTWAEFLGMSVEDAIDYGMKHIMHPEEQAKAKAEFMKSLEQRKPHTLETRMKRWDGEWRWTLNKSSPLLLPNGVLIGYVATSIDITDRKEAEERLESTVKNEQLLRRIVEVIGQSFDIDQILNTVAQEVGRAVDADRCGVSRYSFENDEYIYNLSAQYCKEGCKPYDPKDIELLTKAFQKISPETFISNKEQILNITNQEEYLTYLRRMMNTTFPEGLPGLTTEQLVEMMRSYDIRSSLRVNIFYRGTPYGTISISQSTRNRVWTEEEIALLKSIAEHVGGAIYQADLYQQAQETTAQEQIARKQAEMYAKRLEISNRELEQFATIASHDLQEPLRKIQVFSEMLENMVTGEGKDYLNRIGSAASRMRILMDDLLTLSRITRKGKPFQAVDLNETIATVLDDMQIAIQDSGAEIKVEPLEVIQADQSQMQQLLQNLISNAIKYQNAGVKPQVHIYATRQRNLYEITVEDNGIGIKPEYHERIFEPFQRLHGKGSYLGTGMGLTICKKIVERHGGKLSLTSEEGKGSRFIVALPA